MANKISTYLIAIVIFTIFVGSIVGIISEANREEPTVMQGEQRFQTLNKTFNMLDNITTYVDNASSGIEKAETSNFGVFGVLNSLINTAWQSLKFTVSSLGFMGYVFSGISLILGIPTWITAAILTITTIIIVFAIFSAIFQRDI